MYMYMYIYMYTMYVYAYTCIYILYVICIIYKMYNINVCVQNHVHVYHTMWLIHFIVTVLQFYPFLSKFKLHVEMCIYILHNSELLIIPLCLYYVLFKSLSSVNTCVWINTPFSIYDYIIHVVAFV